MPRCLVAMREGRTVWASRHRGSMVPRNEPGPRGFARMHLVEIFLPLHDNHGTPFSGGNFAEVRQHLVEQFGGLTAFTRSPAEGTEKDGGRKRCEPMIVFEIMTEQL